MKTSAAPKLVIIFAVMVVVIGAQWRTASRLRHENRELQGVREQAEQARTELEQATQTSVQRESESQSLRTEVITLRSELQTARQELEQAQSASKKAATALGTAGRPGTGDIPRVPGRWPSQERTVFHMHPTVRTNLTPLPSGYSYSYKSGGRVDDVELWNSITGETITAGPDWWLTQPLPLSFTDGEAIARGELRKLVHDESVWEVSNISLHRLRDGGSTKWHYAFEFAPIDRTAFDTFTVHVSMAGVPGTTGLRTGDLR